MSRDLPPIARLADYYPPRPGMCVFTAVPHTASETYVIGDELFFEGQYRICSTHLYLKVRLAVWPNSWLNSPRLIPDNRPLPKEMIERGQTKKDDT